MANKSNDMKYFWTSLPGILTGVAAVISAIGGILIIFYGVQSDNIVEPTVLFEANPDNITSGKGVTLSWSVSDATDVIIKPGVGSVDLRGSKTVYPTETTTYILIAQNEDKTTKTEKIISVELGPVIRDETPPTIESFEANPDNIVSGEDVTLSWSVSNATVVSIDQDVGIVEPRGLKTVHPTETTTYTLNATNDVESIERSKTVYVKEPYLEIEFVNISAGTFMMGSLSDEVGRQADEDPAHEVTIEAFELGKYEVTQEQWLEVMDRNPSTWVGDDLPVGHVSKNDVEEFIEKLNEKEGTDRYRLPTEAEWEYACRAGTDTMYSFGADDSKLGNYAWYKTNSGGRYHPVGQKKPNPWGLYDMYGNVWEWVQDDSHISYYDAPSDGSAWGSGDTSRGGSFYSMSRFCRSANRNSCDPEDTIGFRLVREL